MDGVLPAAVALGLAAATIDILRPLGVFVVSCGTYVLVKHLLSSRARLQLAPGPTRWPIVGNAFQIPQVNPWLTYSKWADTYGDIMHLDVFGQPIIVINSVETARDLLDKRSSIYSERPHLIMAGDLVGYSEGFVLQPYGEEWRRQRKLVNADFAQGTVPRYYRLQETEARKLVQAVLENPRSLVRQVKMRIAAIIMEANYGYTVKSEDDPFISIPFAAMANFSKASAPGAWLVDFIPQLQHLPSWVPGTGFLRTARDWREICMNATWNPYRWCKQNLPTGVAHTPSLCATSLLQADGELSKEDEHTLVWAASAVLGGGLDTNMSTILTFFLAMLHYSDVQAKAQAEIDAEIGTDRLPSIADRASLPYIRSLVTEVYRWNPAVPLCIPHSLNETDVYNGVHLPKGSLVVPNVWHMLHDPMTYADPIDFKPERYGNSDAEMQKVTDLTFGFGRRACPGFYFAQGTMFAVIATVLATCQIVPAIDERGTPIIPKIAYTSGSIVFPEAFGCNLRSRSESAREMLSRGIPSSD